MKIVLALAAKEFRDALRNRWVAASVLLLRIKTAARIRARKARTIKVCLNFMGITLEGAPGPGWYGLREPR